VMSARDDIVQFKW